MTFLSLLKTNEFFTLEIKRLEKTLAKKLIKIGLIPNKKFKVYFKNLSGGVIVGNEYLKIALDSSLVNKLVVLHIK